ncbi:hypothetical protein P153DRAFT_368049 [Dothidotthia symphoricarpi CBS 119687]|uniref:Transcriptional regulator Ngg1 n=1 Tax=Dothidotthia symphoricarpi CBS 119687 TaxID=1392245 RepID=A0A6A6AAD4_9PLEO|nr:uncharacterized protein P153DRAFT_368049 [Dothidotthia symphoricarpi CBS 119687]KAF2128173.1 hypothetical protein P153DRAFT_368049 [Dothidotthia symphoricarpi CBS 119687]
MGPTHLSSKGKPKPGGKASNAPRSRNTTPLPSVHASVEPTMTASTPATTSYLSKSLSVHLAKKLHVTVEEILDRGGSGQGIPTAAALVSMREAIVDKVLKKVETRCTTSEGGLRELHGLRKHRAPREREKVKKVTKKHDEDSKHPPTTGAHGLARQDGVDVHKGDHSSAVSSPISHAAPSHAGTGPADAPSPSASELSHQPAPAPAVPQFQTFGPDPSKFDDPTIYHIRDVTPGMPDEERKEIYSVRHFPPSDLRDQTAGTPPDKDFSNAKPATQVNATVFANYVEPYIRPLTEEDVAFLKERGDRIAPFVLPRRGQRHYKDIWAEEDGAMHIDSNDQRSAPNMARGAGEDITEDILETDLVSSGPLLARLVSLLRPEGRGAQPSSHDTNGLNGDAMDIDDGANPPADTNSTPAATQLPDFLQPGWRAPQQPVRTDYASLDDRMLLELKHYGLISETDAETSSYDSHFDDEVAQRLRFLQEELRKQSIVNGARKQRLLELTQERIAQQEYNTIADDLDNQLNAAYLKRNRNIGKGKSKNKRPGGAGGGSHVVANGVSRPGVGEPIRTLMERRAQWRDTIGPVVNYGKTGLPNDTVFADDKMKELESREVEVWNTEAEE